MPHTLDRPTDRAGVRRANLALLVRLLRRHGAQSRAQLAVRAGLGKATVSNLVAELESRDLVRAGGRHEGGHGRPGQLVELKPRTAWGIGLEVDTGHVGSTVLDLSGTAATRRRTALDVRALGPERTLDELAALADAAMSAVDSTVAGIAVAVPGLTDDATVRAAPSLRWRDVDVAAGLAARTGFPLDRITAGHNAGLAALAETDTGAARGCPDVVFLLGGPGVGAGLISGGALLRGAEAGHVSLEPAGHPCVCGRRGCWQTAVGIDAFLRSFATPGDLVCDPALDLAQRTAVVRQRAQQGDRRVLGALARLGAALGHGIAVFADLLGPRMVVLGGYFAALREWLTEPVRIELAARSVTAEAGGPRIVASRLGFSAVGTGAAQAAIRPLLDDPTPAPAGTPVSVEA
ncbi:ROK family transcriptional regulator [Amycolatopsis endophytica]|uniref:Putative NBD/HSP70 family sugar kinase n=1 Tax=Amycolatopsis endophytica TaxID=860233 RepID=A0A853BD56_9PSEU|nr:ROK family protein [Amycolatopsis endophytica]NYI92601.1 putative NBD/HSP70 family sugar kinase [Amycolatopsis endophytica]